MLKRISILFLIICFVCASFVCGVNATDEPQKDVMLIVEATTDPRLDNSTISMSVFNKDTGNTFVVMLYSYADHRAKTYIESGNYSVIGLNVGGDLENKYAVTIEGNDWTEYKFTAEPHTVKFSMVVGDPNYQGNDKENTETDGTIDYERTEQAGHTFGDTTFEEVIKNENNTDNESDTDKENTESDEDIPIRDDEDINKEPDEPSSENEQDNDDNNNKDNKKNKNGALWYLIGFIVISAILIVIRLKRQGFFSKDVIN